VRFHDTPFRRQGPNRVELLPAHIEADACTLEARLAAPGTRGVRVRFSLPHHEKALLLEMVIDKEPVTTPEAVYLPFPVDVADPRFHLELNGVALEPEVEQLPGSCRDWYGIQRWAEVGGDGLSVIVAPLDAPLIQVGGITTGRWAHHLAAEQGTLVSWALHNHWDTNFKASQAEDLLLRYRFTSLPTYDSAEAARFAMEASVPPLIVRVPGADTGRQGQLLAVEPEGVAEVHLKGAVDGRGLIAHVRNLTGSAQDLILTPQTGCNAAWLCTPLEDDLGALSVTAGRVTIPVPGRAFVCARLL
jgi:alpha-mannosidase